MNKVLKVLKHFPYGKALVVLLLMASCTPIELFYTTKENNKLGSNCQKVDVTVPKDVAIRKTFLTKQTLTPTSGRQRLEFRIDDLVDLKRRMLLNVTQGSKPLSRLKVWLNGQEVHTFLANSVLLTAEIPDMVVDLCPNMKQGVNSLEIEVQGASGSSAELFVDGFIMPRDILSALDSYNLADISQRTRKGRLGIKLIEGLKVRLYEDRKLSEQLVDLSGISLYPLRVFLQEQNITKIQLTFPGIPEEHDELERKLEAANGADVPNRNLKYSLLFDPNRDLSTMQKMTEVLMGMPFIEGTVADNLVYVP